MGGAAARKGSPPVGENVRCIGLRRRRGAPTRQAQCIHAHGCERRAQRCVQLAVLALPVCRVWHGEHRADVAAIPPSAGIPVRGPRGWVGTRPAACLPRRRGWRGWVGGCGTFRCPDAATLPPRVSSAVRLTEPCSASCLGRDARCLRRGIGDGIVTHRMTSAVSSRGWVGGWVGRRLARGVEGVGGWVGSTHHPLDGPARRRQKSPLAWPGVSKTCKDFLLLHEHW